jgi:hypothetical protein
VSGWRAPSKRLGKYPDLYRAIEAERKTPGRSCTESRPLLGLCTRDPGHPGRHMAQGMDLNVLGAWPGAHEPTIADLTAVPS